MGKDKKKRKMKHHTKVGEWVRFYKRLERFADIREAFIKQHQVTPKDLSYETKHRQSAYYSGVPEEIMIMIFEYLSYSDIVTMSTTCRTMAEFVYRNFLPSIVLPLSPGNLAKLGRRRILSLVSTFNIMILDQCRNGEYLTNVKELNLSELQKLVFVLFEYSPDHIYPDVHILPPLYKDVLSYYLSQSKLLTHLHISIDRSRKTFDIIDIIADSLPCLYKIVLQATNNTDKGFNSPIECQLSKEMREESRELECDKSCFTFNNLLARLLKNTSIRSLEIINLKLYQKWGQHYNYNIEIESDYLRYLRIEQDSFGGILHMDCPQLLEFKHVDLNLFGEPTCLLHEFEDLFIGGYDVILQWCPCIESINSIDVASLRNGFYDRKECEVRDIDESWGDLLKEVCPCENMSDY